MRILKKIQTMLSNSDGDVLSDTKFTNQKLVDKVEEAFIAVLKRDSVDDRLIYDCNFMIVVSSEIYDRVALHAPSLAKSIVKRFYKVLKKSMVNKSHFTPIGNYWDIQFVPKEFLSGADFGDIEIISQVTAKKSWVETLKSEASIGSVSINGKHSKYTKWDINPDAMQGVDIVEKGRIRILFNKKLELNEESDMVNHAKPGQTAEKQSNETNENLAQIKFDENGTKMEFFMKKNILTIGRASSTNEKTTLSKLVILTQDTTLKENHFQIKYDVDSRIFYIAAYAPAIVNGEQIKVSYSIENPQWHSLKQKSNILCGLYHIQFKALK